MSNFFEKIFGDAVDESAEDLVKIDENQIVTQEDLGIIQDTSLSILSTLSFDEVLQNSIDRLVNRYKFLGGLLFLVQDDYVYAKTISGSALAEAFLKLIGKPVTDLHIAITPNSENYVVKTIQTGQVYSSNDLYDFTKGVLNESITNTAGFVTRTQSCISVPIKYQNKTIGAMFFSKSSQEDFTKEIKLLTLIASQIGIAIVNSQLFSDVKKQYDIVSLKNTQLDQINTYTNRIITSLEPRLLVQDAIDSIPEIFGSKYIAAVYTALDKENNVLSIQGYSENRLAEKTLAILGLNPGEIKVSVDDPGFANNINVRVLKDDEPKFGTKMHDIAQGLAPDFAVDEVQKFLKITCVVAVPIKVRNEVTGVLDFFLTGPSIDEVKETELDTMLIIANQLTTALENASLYHQVDSALAELKITNKQLQEKYQFEKDMMGIMGHELRSPMTIARGMAELLIGKLKNKTPIEDQYLSDKLNKIYTSVLKESDLIQTLLSASHLDNNKLTFTYSEFNFHDLVDFAFMTFRKDAEEKKLEFKSESEKGDLMMYSDQSRVQEIVNNLISNAIKYTDEGHVIVKTEVDGNNIKFSVEDTGMGIPQDELSNIGKKFYRVQETDQSKQKAGTGLGLYVVKGILDAMGGKLEVESHEGKGSKFIAIIPMKIQPAKDQQSSISGDMFTELQKTPA